MKKLKFIVRFIVTFIICFAIIYLSVFLGAWKLFESGDQFHIEIGTAWVL